MTMPRTPPRPSPLCFLSSSDVWYVQKMPQIPHVTMVRRIVRPLLWKTLSRSFGTSPRVGRCVDSPGGGGGDDGGGGGGGVDEGGGGGGSLDMSAHRNSPRTAHGGNGPSGRGRCRHLPAAAASISCLSPCT